MLSQIDSLCEMSAKSNVNRESALCLRRYVKLHPNMPSGFIAYDQDGMAFILYDLPTGSITVTFLPKDRVSIFRKLEKGSRFSDQPFDTLTPEDIFEVT